MNDIYFDDEILSYWAYFYCSRHEDDPKVRNYITDPTDAYLYCKNVRSDVKKLKELSKKRKSESPYV